MKLSGWAAIALLGSCALAQSVDELGKLEVSGSTEARMENSFLLDTIERTEVISRERIEHKQAGTLAEAIDKEPGVNVSTACSMCAIKRVQLGGLKGEHTSVLYHGVPLHSTVSSYYGMDAIPAVGMERIDIARGPGASMSAPEAIGGTVNIIPRQAHKNGVELDVSAGEKGYRNYSVVGTAVSDDRKTRAVVWGGYNFIDQEDNDNNGVNEAPALANHAVSARLTKDLGGEAGQVDLIVNRFQSNVFGGPMTQRYNHAVRDGDETNVAFEGGNVNNSYTGDAIATLEKIETAREEVLARWIKPIGNKQLILTAAGAEQIQDSMYEGLDYYNKDTTHFADARLRQPIGDSHLMAFGVDVKQEKMRSKSAAFSSEPSDGFDYQAIGVYVQDEWLVTNAFELGGALRATQITTDWIDQTAKKNEIDKTLIVPRLHARLSHNEHLTSRLSAGMGYRSPLTFFESEHGIIGNGGFGVDIDAIEESQSVLYSLSFDGHASSVTASIGQTNLKNIAYIEEESGTPTLTNLKKTVWVRSADVVGSYQASDALTLSAGVELFEYDDLYKAHQDVAAIEQRVKTGLYYEANGWSANVDVTWIGERDLSEYGYGNRFNDDAASDPKGTKSKAFSIVDVKVSKALDKNLSLYAGVKNLFDTLQTDHESPLFYDDAGEYDVGHIWGQLRGRMAYAGVQAKF